MNEKSFYDVIRADLFGGIITANQVEGISAIINEYESQQINNAHQLAYILATVFHETAKTMQPIEEYGKGRGYDYGKKLDIGTGPGHRIPYTQPDKIFYGRGHTQNTWLTNYRNLTNAAKKRGKEWDFVNHPELLLQMEPSIWATFYAMRNGTYTGKKLSNYFTSESTDFFNARKIINGMDKAETISGYASTFYKAITAV